MPKSTAPPPRTVSTWTFGSLPTVRARNSRPWFGLMAVDSLLAANLKILPMASSTWPPTSSLFLITTDSASPVWLMAPPCYTRAAPPTWTFGTSSTPSNWTKKYISTFSGDPDQITAVGFSAGGSQVLFQLTVCCSLKTILTNSVLLTRSFTFPALCRSRWAALQPWLCHVAGFVHGDGHHHGEVSLLSFLLSMSPGSGKSHVFCCLADVLAERLICCWLR